MYFSLVALLFLSVRADDSVDWSTFEVQTLVNGQENLDLIRQLPIQQYWDVQKGSFRSGLIGETIRNEFPEFVSYVERKVVRGGKALAADGYVVDTTSLFMCSLSAVQELINIEFELSAKYKMYSREDDLKHINDSFEYSYSLEDLVAQQQALQLQNGYIQQIASNCEFTKASASELLDSRRSSKQDHLTAVHADLLKALTAHLSSLNSSRVEKFSDLSDVVQKAELARRSQKQGYLTVQHEEEVQALRQTLNITMQAVAFRAAAELQAAHSQRAFEEGRLLATRAELLQQEVETLINTFFEELYGYVLYVQANPAVAVMVARNTLLGVFLILLVFELGNLALLVSRRLSANSSLPKVVRLKAPAALRNNSGSQPSPSPSLTWALSADQQLHRALTAVSVAATHRLPLPNLLVSGPAGSGKSSMCEAILQHIAIAATTQTTTTTPVSSLVVCGADLQALGNGTATGFLNDLISKYSLQRREAIVLVIDDADCIVAARDSDSSSHLDRNAGDNRGNYEKGNGDRMEVTETAAAAAAAVANVAVQGANSNGSLFALLTGLRENSPFVSVVMTVRLPLPEVDSAVLDRMDHCVGLSLPSPAQRLLYMVGGLSALNQKQKQRHSDGEGLWVGWELVVSALAETSCTTASVTALLRRVYSNAVNLEQDWSSNGSTAAGTTGTLTSHDETYSSSNSSNSYTAGSRDNSNGKRYCPEMDRPEQGSEMIYTDIYTDTDVDAGTVDPADAGVHIGAAALTSLLRTCMVRADPSSSFPSPSFHVLPCLKLALLVSAGWSYRDLKQLFSALNYTILCSDRCQMSDKIWIQELIYSLE